MIPKSISKAVQSPQAVELRRRMDAQRNFFGGIRREGLKKLDVPGMARDFKYFSISTLNMLKSLTRKRRRHGNEKRRTG